MARRFEMWFKSDFYRCVFGLDALRAKITHSDSFVSLHRYWAPEWNVFDGQDRVLDGHRSRQTSRIAFEKLQPTSSSNVSRTTCSHKSLLCVSAQTCHCTVKPAMTAARNIGTFIGLFRHWVCLVWQSLATQIDNTSVWIGRRILYLNFFRSSYFRVVKLLTSARTDADVVTSVTRADRSVQSVDIWTQQIQFNHLQLTVWAVCVKIQI